MTRVKSGSRRLRRRPVQEAGVRPGAEVRDTSGQDHPAQDWSAIEVGTTVHVIPTEGLPQLGRVDAKTPDSAIVWVLNLEGSGRQMHGNRDGIRLRSVPSLPW
jgi:hypothetical protein